MSICEYKAYQQQQYNTVVTNTSSFEEPVQRITDHPFIADFGKNQKLQIVSEPINENQSPLLKYMLTTDLDKDPISNEYIISSRDSNELRSLKKIIVSDFTINESLKIIKKDFQSLKKLKHPGIVKLYDAYYDNKNSFYEILEHVEGTRLIQSLPQLKHLGEGYISVIFYQIINSLSHCHNLGIIHKEIKPENIIICKQYRNGYPLVKLTGFGIGNNLADKPTYKNMSISNSYNSPESIEDGYIYEDKFDMWSCGVLLHYILYDRLPFEEKKDDPILKLDEDKPSEDSQKKISKEAENFLGKLLKQIPFERIDAQSALADEWFIKNKTEEKLKKIEGDIIKKFFTNILSFKITNDLQIPILEYLSHNLTDKLIEEDASNLFYILDTHNEGTLERNEFIKKATILIDEYKVEYDVHNLNTIFNNMDFTYSNSVEKNLFIIACIPLNDLIEDNNLLKSFNFFRDGDEGYDSVDFSEIRKRIFSKDSTFANDFTDRLKDLDQNNNGEIDYNLYKKLILGIVKEN